VEANFASDSWDEAEVNDDFVKSIPKMDINGVALDESSSHMDGGGNSSSQTNVSCRVAVWGGDAYPCMHELGAIGAQLSCVVQPAIVLSTTEV
jgi:hypothetical protein